MNSHKTAISRSKLSRPARIFEPHLYGKVLDFGCGKGSDANILGATKYDLHFFPKKPEKESFDCVMVIYVLNSVVYPADVLKTAKEYLKPDGLLMVATRTVNEVRRQAKQNFWKPHGRGWLTSTKTFQRGLSAGELASHADYDVIEFKNSPFSYIIARKPK